MIHGTKAEPTKPRSGISIESDPIDTQVNTTYGVDGRPTEIRVNGDVLIQNITYQPFGAVKGWTWGNGQAHTRSFDLDGRLTQHPVGSDTRSLTYDAASQIIQTSDTNPVYNRGYSYDELGRLIGQSDNTSTRLWTYDANSNRTSVQPGSTSSGVLGTQYLILLDAPMAKTGKKTPGQRIVKYCVPRILIWLIRIRMEMALNFITTCVSPDNISTMRPVCTTISLEIMILKRGDIYPLIRLDWLVG